MSAMTENRKPDDEAPPPRPVALAEWAVAAVGAALVVGVLGVLAHEAMTYEDGPPVIVTTVDGVTRTPAGYVARFTAKNEGHATAAEIKVVATLKDGQRTIEEADVTLDYVARKSSREAGVIFQRDPATATLEIRATSYRKP